MKKCQFSRIAALALTVLFFSPLILSSETKNYYFPEVRIEIQVQKDGSFTVDEFRTYEFEGSFSWASLWIPLQVERQGYKYDVRISDFQVLDEREKPLLADVSTSDGKFQAKWSYQARNERRTFHIHYAVQGGIISYPDVTELYWQAIGSGWDKPTAKATVVVKLPEPLSRKEDIRIFGHGPLSGWSQIVDKRTARFTAENIRSRQFLEIRMIWPSGLVTGVSSSRHSWESIREEEARFVRETIAKVKEAQEAEEYRHRIFIALFHVWCALFIITPLLWLAIFLSSWKKVGKDYRFSDIPRYFRDLPSNLQPALVEVLLREGGSVTPRSFTATLFDLARRGYMEIDDRIEEKRGLFGKKEEVETFIICRKDYQRDGSLLSYEKELLDLLFKKISGQEGRKGASLTLDDLKKYLKKKPQEFQEWYLEWKKDIQNKAKSFKFIEPKSNRTKNIFLAATIPLAILTLNPLLVVLAAILIPTMKRRDKKWARENEMWKALERFLDDFSDFDELSAEAYRLWEHYLVYGIIFGNAKKILKSLPLILRDSRATAPIWYYGFDRSSFLASGRMESMIRSIESMATSIQQASTSAAHYSSGSGGGFSGGGSGGGGGGGGRAG